ncbi:MAG: hypothetical protein KAQ85_01215, partial [Thermodesulfovibrionia bacterium]|nr:hypothetical protein [Thermodesulfovibrionia bacterium]
IAEFGYVPKKYRLDFEETVAYEDPIFIKKQSELSSAAEQLFVEGAQIGYLPTQRIPIGGDIDELESFIKEEKKNIAQFKKDKEKYNKQKEKDAKYLGINPELMGTSEGYDQLRLQMRNSDDRRLIDIYKNYFQEVDPYNYKLTKEESSKLIESGWGDGSMQSVIDLAKVVAYGAATGPMWIPAVEALFANPLFHLYMDVEFARHAPQEFMDAYEIVKNNPPEDRLGAFVNLAFGTMGIGSATRLFRQGAAGVTKGFQGVKRTKDILKGTPVSTGPITNTAADLQAGNYVDEFGNVVMIAQGKGPLSIQYTRQGKKGVDILDAQGNLVKRATGEGNVVIGFGQTE